jgi:hypothetical protein
MSSHSLYESILLSCVLRSFVHKISKTVMTTNTTSSSSRASSSIEDFVLFVAAQCC